MTPQYQSYQEPRQTRFKSLARTALRGGGVMVIVATAAFTLEWTLPKDKKPLTAIATTIAKIGTIEVAADTQTELIRQRLNGAVERRQAQANSLMEKETSLKKGKADWDVKCGFVDIIAGGLCGGLVDMTYDGTIAEVQTEYAAVETDIAEIQETVSGIPARSGAWDRPEQKAFSFSFEKDE